MPIVELHRSFLRHSDGPNHDFGIFDGLLSRPKERHTFDWNALLAHSLVVVLAEALSGKTTEFQSCVRRLNAEGKFAFFVRVDRLAQAGLASSLGLERQMYKNWLASNDPAWFFLDSVDEARLSRIDFEHAVQRFAEETHLAKHRSHVYISCRVSDWRAESDQSAIEKHIATSIQEPSPTEMSSGQPERDLLLDPIFLKKDRYQSGVAPAAPQVPSSLLVVRIAPLNIDQIYLLAKAVPNVDADRFITSLRLNKLDSLAERPGDALSPSPSRRYCSRS